MSGTLLPSKRNAGEVLDVRALSIEYEERLQKPQESRRITVAARRFYLEEGSDGKKPSQFQPFICVYDIGMCVTITVTSTTTYKASTCLLAISYFVLCLSI